MADNTNKVTIVSNLMEKIDEEDHNIKVNKDKI